MMRKLNVYIAVQLMQVIRRCVAAKQDRIFVAQRTLQLNAGRVHNRFLRITLTNIVAFPRVDCLGRYFNKLVLRRSDDRAFANGGIRNRVHTFKPAVLCRLDDFFNMVKLLQQRFFQRLPVPAPIVYLIKDFIHVFQILMCKHPHGVFSVVLQPVQQLANAVGVVGIIVRYYDIDVLNRAMLFQKGLNLLCVQRMSAVVNDQRRFAVQQDAVAEARVHIVVVMTKCFEFHFAPPIASKIIGLLYRHPFLENATELCKILRIFVVFSQVACLVIRKVM